LSGEIRCLEDCGRSALPVALNVVEWKFTWLRGPGVARSIPPSGRVVCKETHHGSRGGKIVDWINCVAGLKIGSWSSQLEDTNSKETTANSQNWRIHQQITQKRGGKEYLRLKVQVNPSTTRTPRCGLYQAYKSTAH
jgi:hypothetical protein